MGQAGREARRSARSFSFLQQRLAEDSEEFKVTKRANTAVDSCLGASGSSSQGDLGC